MTEDITEEQGKALKKAAGAVWDLGLPLVRAIDTAETETWLRVIKVFIEYLGELVEKKRQELQDKEGK